MLKLRKSDAELLALMADETNPHSAVYYVPGRDHATNSEARTRWSYQRYQPASVGMKLYVRVTAPVSRLVAAGFVEDVEGDERQRVRVTAAGRQWLAAAGASPAPEMSETQRTAILAAHAGATKYGQPRGSVYGLAAAVSVRAMQRNGWINGYNVTRAGLIAAGVDMDALHAEALDERASRNALNVVASQDNEDMPRYRLFAGACTQSNFGYRGAMDILHAEALTQAEPVDDRPTPTAHQLDQVQALAVLENVERNRAAYLVSDDVFEAMLAAGAAAMLDPVPLACWRSDRHRARVERAAACENYGCDIEAGEHYCPGL